MAKKDFKVAGIIKKIGVKKRNVGSPRFSHATLALFVVAFAGIGIYTLTRSKAAVTCDVSVNTSTALNSAVGSSSNSGKTICVTANITGSRTWTIDQAQMTRIVAQPDNMTIKMGSITFNGASNLTVEGFDFGGNGTDITGGGANIKLLRNWFHDATSDGLFITGSSTNIEFSGNLVERISFVSGQFGTGYGVYATGGPHTGFKAMYNTFNMAGDTREEANSSDSMELGNLRNFTVSNNVFKNIDSFDGTGEDPHADTLMIWAGSQNGTVSNNRMFDGTDFLLSPDGSDILIENNLLVRQAQQCLDASPNGTSGNVAPLRFTFRKNTVWTCGGPGINMSGAVGSRGQNVMDRNLVTSLSCASSAAYTSTDHNIVNGGGSCLTGTNISSFSPSFQNTVDYLPTNLPAGYTDVGYRAVPAGHTNYPTDDGSSCTQTLSAGANVASEISAAAAGSTICLNNGSYGAINLGTFTKSPRVTVRAVNPQGASVAGVNASGTSPNGVTLEGLKMTANSAFSSSNNARNITIKDFDFGVYQLDIRTNLYNNNNILVDGSTFGAFNENGGQEGRLSILYAGGPGANPSGVTVTNNTFGPGGCSDGIQLGGNGTVIGPGNIFTGIVQGSCSTHVDGMQGYGDRNSVVTGNYFDGSNTVDIGWYDDGSGHTFTNNVFQNAVTSFRGLSDSTITHNTFSGSAFRIEGKSGSPSNMTIKDNIFKGIGITGPTTCTGCTITHNMFSTGGFGNDNITGTPTFTGGASPAAWAGWALSAGSIGKSAATDGQDMGTTYYGTGGVVTPPSDSIPPAVSLSAPANGATVTGNTTVSATASDNVGVVGVQFKLNGNNIGQEDTSSPYSISWNSATVANGTYTITAVARDAAGNTTTSSGRTITTSNTSTCSTSSASWANQSISSQTGTFTFDYDATPDGSNIDSVTGLSNGAADDYADLAAAVRFNPSGFIDARNGGAYAAAAQVAYQGGTSYHIRMTVNMTNKTYTVEVTPQGGSKVILATNYAFRSEQSSVGSLNNWAVISPVGSHTVCGVVVGSGSPPTGKTGDLNNDNSVNIFDLSILLSNYGKTRTQASPQTCDINNDNNVNIFDLSILLSNYGK